ncbi:hypothetical protein J6590_065000 [Homalodisca vitripennis]|nr:hypothetical protein J6590_065000 [Homalodisca vitripennis]
MNQLETHKSGWCERKMWFFGANSFIDWGRAGVDAQRARAPRSDTLTGSRPVSGRPPTGTRVTVTVIVCDYRDSCEWWSSLRVESGGSALSGHSDTSTSRLHCSVYNR